MKNVGKIAVLAMTLALAAVLTACGGNASSSAAASSAAASSSSAAASDASTSASSASAASSDASASASSAAESADTYKNEYFEIKFSLPDGWTFVDAEKIKDTNASIANTSENAIVDMVATSSDLDKMVIIALEDLSSASTKQTAEEYLAAQQQKMESGLEGNYSYVAKDVTVTFEGMKRELPASITTLSINGVDIAVGQAVAEKDGVFMDIIIIGSSEEDVSNTFTHFTATAE